MKRVVEHQDDPIVVVTEWTSFDGYRSIAIEDFIWAYINAGYTKVEVMRLPEVKMYYRIAFQKRIRKIIKKRQRQAFRKASYDWLRRK